MGTKLGATLPAHTARHAETSAIPPMAIPSGRNNKSPQQRSNSPRGPQGARPAAAAASVKPKKKDDDGEGEIEMEGVVSAVLAGTMFRVRVANGHEFLAHISG